MKFKNNGFFYLITFTLFVLISFNYDNADYLSYQILFENANFFNISNYDLGFFYLIQFFKMFGFSYSQFFFIISSTLIILLARRIYVYSKNPSLVLLLYGIFPFFYDIVQIRNLIVLVFLVYSIKYLMVLNFKNFFVFVSIIILASLFHIIALIYLIYIFAYIKNIKRLIFITFLITIVSSFLILQEGILSTPLVMNFLNNLNSRILFYIQFNSSVPIEARLQFIFYILGYTLLTTFMYFKENHRIFNSSPFQTILVKISLISVFFIPFILIDPNFFRTYRNILIIIYLFISQYSFKVYFKNFTFTTVVFAIFLIIPLLSFFNFLVVSSTLFNSVTIKILSNNYFFDLFPLIFILTGLNLIILYLISPKLNYHSTLESR